MKRRLRCAARPFNPAIPVQYSGQGWQAFDAPAFDRSGPYRPLKTQIKTSDFGEASALSTAPLVNVTKT
jgi:hypothetical protein